MALFTFPIDKYSIRIISPCCVDVKNYKRGSNNITEFKCDTAMWDTGSSVTLISERIAAELGLVHTGTTIVSGFDGRTSRANTYRIDLRFTDDISINFIEAVSTPSPFFDLLIGMDVISQGNFHVDSIAKQPQLSFEV